MNQDTNKLTSDSINETNQIIEQLSISGKPNESCITDNPTDSDQVVITDDTQSTTSVPVQQPYELEDLTQRLAVRMNEVRIKLKTDYNLDFMPAAVLYVGDQSSLVAADELKCKNLLGHANPEWNKNRLLADATQHKELVDQLLRAAGACGEPRRAKEKYCADVFSAADNANLALRQPTRPKRAEARDSCTFLVARILYVQWLKYAVSASTPEHTAEMKAFLEKCEQWLAALKADQYSIVRLTWMFHSYMFGDCSVLILARDKHNTKTQPTPIVINI